ncbi:MAG: cysteine hydrolase [Dehalococcoidia bacterium]|nr:cysteine hydrolase [Dehalococcoidia bacterium]
MPDALKLDPKKTAFIIIDMINSTAKGQGPPYTLPPGRVDLVKNFQKLIAQCRAGGSPIIYITTYRRPDGTDAPRTIADAPPPGGGGGQPLGPNDPGPQVIDELKPEPEDYIVAKPRFSSFYGTNVGGILNERGIDTILVGGISTPRSVEGTAREAKNLDMQCVVVSDCCDGPEKDVHEYILERVLPLLVRVRTTDEVVTALS